MARYRSTEVPTTPEISQLERWLRTETDEIQNSTDDIYVLAEAVVDYYAVAGYGGIGLDAVTPIADISASPRRRMPFDVVLVNEPRGVEYNLAQDGIQFQELGIWRMNAKISLEFTEVNAGRRMSLQLFNLNTATDVGPVFNFAIGRNTDGVNLNFNLLVDIPEEILGDTLVLRAFSVADTFTNVQAIGSIWDANHVSEYRGDIFESDSNNVEARTRWP